MASELDARLSPAAQIDVVTDAAARLEPGDSVNTPLDATLTALDQRGLIESYTRSPYSVDLDEGAGSVLVAISGYALAARESRLPVLPLTLELCQHQPKQPPRSVRVTAIAGGWQLTVALADAGDQQGLVNAPIDGGWGCEMAAETYVEHAQTRVRAEQEAIDAKLEGYESFICWVGNLQLDQTLSSTAGITSAGGTTHFSADVFGTDRCRTGRRDDPSS